MTKSELIKRLGEKFPHISEGDRERVVSIILREISQSLIKGDRIELRGFGAFSTRKRKPRTARNPKTGEKVALQERSSVYYRAGKDLRDRLNK